jgi:hypothetical protein
MKHLRILGLALVAAAAMTAILGASTASATELCKVMTTPCPAASVYKEKTALKASLVPEKVAELTSSIDNVTCKKSTVGGETTNAGGSGTTAVTGTISSLTFTECTDSFGNSCTVAKEFLPSSASVTGGGTSTPSTFSFNITGKAGANVKCGALINCTFFLENKSLPGQNPVASEESKAMPLITASGVSLSHVSGQGFLCPSTATWNAPYEVTSPTPLVVV